jgi:hypothetical protein
MELLGRPSGCDDPIAEKVNELVCAYNHLTELIERMGWAMQSIGDDVDESTK